LWSGAACSSWTARRRQQFRGFEAGGSDANPSQASSKVKSLESLLGLENLAALYFGAPFLISEEVASELHFSVTIAHKDQINALLSFGYACCSRM